MFCAVSVWAVSYASPYKGAGRNGGIYLTSGVRHATTAEGMAQTPQIAMSSVSRGVSAGGSSRGIAVSSTLAAPRLQGITTMASSITGGVTASTTYAQIGGPVRAGVRKAILPGEPICSECEFDEDGICIHCGCSMYDDCDPVTGECKCVEESGYCWCPLDMNWGAMLFLALLAGGYAMWKKKGTIISGAMQKKYR